MADTKAELAKRVLDLKASVERATTLRAQAETSVAHGKQQLAKIDEQLRALGVDPENAEETLKTMEATLDRKVQELSTLVASEIQAYTKIIETSKAAFA